jgi:hypothetical protein
MLSPKSRQPLRRKEIAVVVVTVCVLVAAYSMKFLMPCAEPEIVFAFPERFEGGFVVIEDDDAAALECASGVFTVDVPPSRVVRVKSFEAFTRMHREFLSMRNADGTRTLSLVNLVPGAGEGALRCLGTEGRTVHGAVLQDRIMYFLGTERDARAYDFFSIPLD